MIIFLVGGTIYCMHVRVWWKIYIITIAILCVDTSMYFILNGVGITMSIFVCLSWKLQ